MQLSRGSAYTDSVQSKQAKLLGFGLIGLVSAWYGITRIDTATEGVPLEDNAVATANAEPSLAETTTETPGRPPMAAASAVLSALPGNVAAPPEEAIACVQASPPPYTDPLRDGRLESEPVDPGWAMQTESMLWNIAGGLGEVKSLQCRTTFCMVTFNYNLALRDMDPATRRIQAIDKVKMLDETMRGLIASSGGRLGHYACRNVGAPFEGFEFDFYVYGPPRIRAE